jgi:hypothetical protein
LGSLFGGSRDLGQRDEELAELSSSGQSPVTQIDVSGSEVRGRSVDTRGDEIEDKATV